MPKLLMIGGNRSTVGSIKALRAAGFTVAVAEKLPRQYAFAVADSGFEVASSDISGLRQVIRVLNGVDGIMGINEAAMQSAAILQLELGLPGLPPQVIHRTCSKLAQRELWSRDPALAVPFAVAHSSSEMREAVDSLDGYPVIVKPDISHGGSRGVSLVADAAGLESAYTFAAQHCLHGSPVLVERSLEGPQFSAELMSCSGKTRVLAIGRKIKSPPPSRVDLAVCYPGITDADVIAASERMCARAKELLGITAGPGHIEFAITEDGPRPIELGARCGGSITPDLVAHVSGYHPMVEAGRLACGMYPMDWPNAGRRGAVLLFFAFPPGPAHALRTPHDVAARPDIIDFDIGLPITGEIASVQWTSQRLGFAGIIGQTGPEAIARARQLASEIQLEKPGGECALTLVAEPLAKGYA